MTGQPLPDIPLDAATDAAVRAAELAFADAPATFLGILNSYLPIFVVAFVVTLFATPVMRRLALANGIIDHPSDPRKIHREPVAYLGGVAVFLGIMAAILVSYLAVVFPISDFHRSTQVVEADGFFHLQFVRPSIVLGMFVIMLVGLLDDVVGIEPRLKIGGQLFAAAALAIDDVGVNVAKGILQPLGQTLFGYGDLVWTYTLPPDLPLLGGHIVTFDLVYWTGTAIIAVFVLGACNASNLIDGLDGLLSGTTAIAAAGLLVIAIGLAVDDDGRGDSQRIILAMAVMGACLGFLPHNFNPASIFLGDCGSLLLGYSTIVIILTLAGERGWTHLVIAGLIIYAIPLIDTTLAIIRRKMAGRSISDPDDQHLHHMLKRALGVKKAVLTLYAIGAGFAILGVAASFGRARVVYTIALVFISFIAVTAIKLARRQQPAPAPARPTPPKPPAKPKATAAEPEPAGQA